jgi:hypothetical protein
MENRCAKSAMIKKINSIQILRGINSTISTVKNGGYSGNSWNKQHIYNFIYIFKTSARGGFFLSGHTILIN